ncbi:hypothetical protein C8R44DRAFT_813204 [Mycena epipterygia]|nr:hypothetical protein C8R44DRAFT_813204 [Mycena epipterygia]
MNSATPRLYVYSDTDQRSLLTLPQRRKGPNVRDEELFGSTHVQHSKADPKTY